MNSICQYNDIIYSMPEAKNITHLVHIGFDPAPQPNFESRIVTHLERISDETSHVLNFVDEAPYTSEDGVLLQKNELAETLATFINVCHLKSTTLSQHFDFDLILRDIPKEVIDFIKKRLDGQWQQIQTPCKPLEDFIALHTSQELPDDIRRARDEHDKVRLSLM